MNILMISPSAPPKNGPEAMQVGRYLKALDKRHSITLVTTPVLSKGWITKDESLNTQLHHTDYVIVKLPFHAFVLRLLGSKYFKFFMKNRPDTDFWIGHKVSTVLKRLTSTPDIIYSRSLPFSAALLAKELKSRLGIPWVMHLSDPWIDNPYHKRRDTKLAGMEASCFKFADAVMLTTESMADFYRSKYPEFAEKIHVSHNVMPDTPGGQIEHKTSNQKLTLLYTGALYGDRKATTLLNGLNWVRKRDPELLKHIEVIFVGNMTDEIKSEIEKFHFDEVRCLERVEHIEAKRMQNNADILISIEPDGKSPLLKTFMPSKVLDYMSSGKPILAITPMESETWKLCKRGFGWAVMPGDEVSLGKLLVTLLERNLASEVLTPSVKPLQEYRPEFCAAKLESLMKSLVLNQQEKR